jgi:hypothetical protein
MLMKRRKKLGKKSRGVFSIVYKSEENKDLNQGVLRFMSLFFL